MHRLILLAVFLSLFQMVFSLTPEKLDVPPSQDEINKSCGVMIEVLKGQLEGKITDETQKTRELVEEKNKQVLEELKNRTNPVILNLPTIVLILIICMIYLMLKGRGKI